MKRKHQFVVSTAFIHISIFSDKENTIYIYYLTGHFPSCYNLINIKKDNSLVETHLGYMFRIESIHHQAIIVNK